MTDQQWQDQHLIFERAIRAMIHCPVPVIAAVNGAAFAGGMEISLCCRLHLCGRARAVRADRGDAGHHARRRRHAEPAARGGRAAGEGDPADRQAVHRAAGVEWGMVNRICKADALLAEALETAATIAGNAPISTRQIKQSVNYGLNMDLASGMMFEIEAYNRMVPTEDRREGIRAFNEKRKPVFQGT